MSRFLSVLLAGFILATSPLYGMDPPPGDQSPPEEGTKTQRKQRREKMPLPGEKKQLQEDQEEIYSITIKSKGEDIKDRWGRLSIWSTLTICPATLVEKIGLSFKALVFDGTECTIEDAKDFSQTFNVASLTKLILDSCKPGNITPEISKLSNLTTLSLACNNLLNIPPEIGNLQKLKKLNLHYNNLTELPPEIGNLTNLEVLEISLNQLTTLPSKTGNLTNLKELTMGCNQLTTLPLCITALRKLQRLDFKGNRIDSLPSSICNLQLLGTSTLYSQQRENQDFIFGGSDSDLLGYESDLKRWSSARIYYSTINQINSRQETEKMGWLLYSHFHAFFPKELCDIIFKRFTKVLPIHVYDLELLNCYSNKTRIKNKILKIDVKKNVSYLEFNIS